MLFSAILVQDFCRNRSVLIEPPIIEPPNNRAPLLEDYRLNRAPGGSIICFTVYVFVVNHTFMYFSLTKVRQRTETLQIKQQFMAQNQS